MDIDNVQSLVERQASAWQKADIDAIAADFAPNGVFISPGGSWQGAEAIRGAAVSFFTHCEDVHVKITRVLLNGDVGAVEWTWSETHRATGHRTTTDDGIIFELRDDKIVYWREYFDTAPSKT